MATTDLTTFYAQKFESDLKLLAQQMEPRLPMAAMQGNHKGSKQAVAVEQLGPITVDQRTTRFAPITLSDVNHYRRWVYMKPFNKNIGFDDLDGIQMLQDPKGQYTTLMRAALNRRMDYEMVHAFFASVNTGETGTTAVTFPTSTNQIAVNFEGSGNTGLTFAKLTEARRILRAAEVDLDYEPLYCAITAKQEANLFHEITVISKDFTEKPKVDSGKLSSFMGFNFIHTEQLYLDPTYTGVPVWVPSGMHFGTWLDVGVSIDRRNDLEWQPWQASIRAAFGAVRLEEARVVEILCA